MRILQTPASPRESSPWRQISPVRHAAGHRTSRLAHSHACGNLRCEVILLARQPQTQASSESVEPDFGEAFIRCQSSGPGNMRHSLNAHCCHAHGCRSNDKIASATIDGMSDVAGEPSARMLGANMRCNASCDYGNAAPQMVSARARA